MTNPPTKLTDPNDPKAVLKHLKAQLEYQHDPSLVAFMFQDNPVIEVAGLGKLCYLLGHDSYCCRNDVQGLVDLLEKYVEGQDENRDRSRGLAR